MHTVLQEYLVTMYNKSIVEADKLDLETMLKEEMIKEFNTIKKRFNAYPCEQKDLMDLLSSFVKEASVNEDLFNKSKDLTLSILGASSRKDIIKRVQDNFHKSFNVDKCILSLHDNSEINVLEQETGCLFIRELFIAGRIL